ncbi:MAG: DUF4190 domain-containing protein [Wenzhouxiangellaceae bacterium]
MNDPPRTCSTAIVSLIFGILAWFALPLIGAIVAVIAGDIARREIRASRGDLDGDGLAVAGLVLGWIQLGIFLLMIAVVMLVVSVGSTAQ